MSEKEFALYLYNTMQTKRIDSLTKCLTIGQKLNKELSSIAESTLVSDELRHKFLQIDSEAVRALDAELRVMTDINNEVITFVKYIETLRDTFDKGIMISRYFHGFQWTEIERLTGKSESTVLRRHRKCIREYMTLNNIT